MASDKETSEKVLKFLRNHTKAADAMDAIDLAEWWGGIQQIGSSLDDITLTIEELLVEGTIKKQELENDAFYYELS